MTREEIIEKVNNFLVEDFEIEESALKPEALLKGDLGMDSLDFVDVVIIVNREFGFKPEARDMATIKTLDNFYDYIAAHL